MDYPDEISWSKKQKFCVDTEAVIDLCVYLLNLATTKKEVESSDIQLVLCVALASSTPEVTFHFPSASFYSQQ